VAPVDRVGEAQSRLAAERELGKQLDAEERGVCNQKLNSTVAQECSKKTVVERRDAVCVVNVVQSLCADKSCVAPVDRVGEARSRLAAEQELGKQLDAEERGVCNQKQNSTVAQECGKKTVVEGRDAVCVVNVVQSLCADKSCVAPVDRVGEARSRLAAERELGKQLDAEERGVYNQKQNSTVAQECGEKTVFEGRDAACVVNPSFVTSQKAIEKSHLKDLKVCLKRLSSSLIEKCIRQSNFMETGTVPVSNMSSVVLPADTDRPSSCETSNLTRAPVNTALGAGEGNTVVSTIDCMVLGRKS